MLSWALWGSPLRKVVVVGGGKSAVDNAVSAAKEATSSTLATRPNCVHGAPNDHTLNIMLQHDGSRPKTRRIPEAMACRLKASMVRGFRGLPEAPIVAYRFWG